MTSFYKLSLCSFSLSETFLSNRFLVFEPGMAFVRVDADKTVERIHLLLSPSRLSSSVVVDLSVNCL